jgi:pyruvate carboxylase subunit B
MDPSTVRSLRPHEYVVELNGTVVRVHCPPGGPLEVDGRVVRAQLASSSAGLGQLELEGFQYRVNFDREDVRGREFHIELNGRRIAGTIDDRRSLLRLQMRGSEDADHAVATIKAPMPGLVLKILVSIGQRVEKGQGLLVLEAMKMENEVRCDREATIDSIHVSERGPVEKGQTLITIRPTA